MESKETTARKVSPMKIARVKLGLNQRDLAIQVNISESMVSRIETGRSIPDEELRRKISEVLGIPSYEVA